MVERLGEMREGRREDEKGSRERIEGLREPPFIEFLDPTL